MGSHDSLICETSSKHLSSRTVYTAASAADARWLMSCTVPLLACFLCGGNCFPVLLSFYSAVRARGGRGGRPEISRVGGAR